MESLHENSSNSIAEEVNVNLPSELNSENIESDIPMQNTEEIMVIEPVNEACIFDKLQDDVIGICDTNHQDSIELVDIECNEMSNLNEKNISKSGLEIIDIVKNNLVISDQNVTSECELEIIHEYETQNLPFVKECNLKNNPKWKLEIIEFENNDITSSKNDIFESSLDDISESEVEITHDSAIQNDFVAEKDSENISKDVTEIMDLEEHNAITSNKNVIENELEITHDSANQSSSFEIEYDFKQTPYQVTGSWKEFLCKSQDNFTRGCKWAPDGSCILTCSEDNILRIFNLPPELWDSSQWENITEMEAVVKISEGESIFDYSWYPLMNSSDPTSCCLASTSKRSVVHLWDGFTGELRCSYRAYNHMDEIATPYSLSFDADGQKLYCGFEKFVRVFNVDTPGRNFEERQIFAKKEGQPGIISSFAFTPANRSISAVGSYLKTIGLYSEPSGQLECLLEGQKGGVTHLQFSPDGTYLYSGGRKDPEILCWDMRNLGTVLFSLRRVCTTHQRMYFDISKCGKYVVSGNQNGVVSIWDVRKEPKVINEEEFAVLEPIQFFIAHNDCVNGVSLHPTYPLLCSSSGQRHFPSLLPDDDDDMFSSTIEKCDNSLRLWWLGKSS